MASRGLCVASEYAITTPKPPPLRQIPADPCNGCGPLQSAGDGVKPRHCPMFSAFLTGQDPTPVNRRVVGSNPTGGADVSPEPTGVSDPPPGGPACSAKPVSGTLPDNEGLPRCPARGPPSRPTAITSPAARPSSPVRDDRRRLPRRLPRAVWSEESRAAYPRDSLPTTPRHPGRPPPRSRRPRSQRTTPWRPDRRVPTARPDAIPPGRRTPGVRAQGVPVRPGAAGRPVPRPPRRRVWPARPQGVPAGGLAAGWCRKRVNKQVGRVKRVFAWGVEEQVVPEPVYAALLLVKGLRSGRSNARETATSGRPTRPW